MRVFNSTAALFHDDAQQRALSACFGLSIALHAVLLLAFPGLRSSPHPDGTRSLTATFAHRAEPAEAPSARASSEPPARPREVRPVVPIPEPASAPQVAEPRQAPGSALQVALPAAAQGAPRKHGPTALRPAPPCAQRWPSRIGFHPDAGLTADPETRAAAPHAAQSRARSTQTERAAERRRGTVPPCC